MSALRCVLAVCAICGFSQSLSAQNFDPAARVAAVAPFLDQQTAVIVHADLNRVDFAAMLKMFKQFAPPSSDGEQAQFDAIVMQATDTRAQLLKAGASEWYFIGSAAAAQGGSPGFVVIPTRAGGDPNTVLPILKPLMTDEEAVVHQGSLVLGPAGLKESLAAITPQSREDFVAGFKAAGNTAVQVVAIPSPQVLGMASAMLPPLPDELGGAALKTLVEKLRWVAITANLPPTPAFALIVDMQDAAAAQAVQAGAAKALGALKANQPALPAAQADSLIQLLTPQIRDTQLRIVLTEANGGVGGVGNAVGGVLGAARAAAAANKAAPQQP